MVARKKVLKSRTTTSSVETTPARSVEVSRASVFTKALPVVYGAMLLMAFAVGVLWQRVNYLENTPKTATTDTVGTPQQVAQATPAPVSLDQVKDLFGKDLIKFGDANRKLLFVAVEDPSCPFCHIASGKNRELNNQSGAQFKLVADGGTYLAPVAEMKKLVDAGSASLVYIYTPGHGAGEMGQKALYCAFEKGKFWQAHDLLYSNKGYDLLNTTVQNDKAKSGVIADFLKSVVPANDMKTCLDSGKYDARLASDTALAQSLSVSGTPGFFVNTTRFAGAYSFKDMESAVSEALGK